MTWEEELEAQAKEILKKPYSRIFQKEADGCFSTCILEFIGCYSQGDSLQEAWDNLEDAATGWLMSLLMQKALPPEPLNMWHAQKVCQSFLSATGSGRREY